MGQTVTLHTSDGHALNAYTAGPPDATKALVVIQEIFGVNGHMRRVCDDFAAQGYAVIAPALFDRVEPNIELGYAAADIETGRALRGKIADADTLADIEAAASWCADRSTGIVGYCWGGTVAWMGATQSRSFNAACGWYGGGIVATRSATTNCPVELHFGETDASIPMADVEAIKDAQPDVAVFVYPGAGHGFGCEDRPSYDQTAADLARERTLAFFAAHL